jgi:hypothetical protein
MASSPSHEKPSLFEPKHYLVMEDETSGPKPVRKRSSFSAHISDSTNAACALSDQYEECAYMRDVCQEIHLEQKNPTNSYHVYFIISCK